jgi:hypothetical protein
LNVADRKNVGNLCMKSLVPAMETAAGSALRVVAATWINEARQLSSGVWKHRATLGTGANKTGTPARLLRATEYLAGGRRMVAFAGCGRASAVDE